MVLSQRKNAENLSISEMEFHKTIGAVCRVCTVWPPFYTSNKMIRASPFEKPALLEYKRKIPQ